MISLIFPTYNEKDNIDALYLKTNEVVSSLERNDFEFLFIDDGSTDETPEVLKQLHEKDRRVKVIRLARNSGTHTAIAAGLNVCLGDCAIVMASDLQDPPDLIKELLSEWDKGMKIVWGVRTKREGEKVSTHIFSRFYYFLINRLTAIKMPPMGADVFLADRVVLDVFKEISEKHTSIFMTLAWLGFPQAHVCYVKRARHSGSSKWTLGKKIKLFIDSILSFSDIPIRYMSVLGFSTAIVGFIYAVVVVCDYYFMGTPVGNWSAVLITILVLSGVQMMMLGVLGEYLWRTYDESRKRPRYVIEYKRD